MYRDVMAMATRDPVSAQVMLIGVTELSERSRPPSHFRQLAVHHIKGHSFPPCPFSPLVCLVLIFSSAVQTTGAKEMSL